MRTDAFHYRLKLMADLASVFERPPSARVAFQVRTVNRYLDTQPMRNLFLTYLKKHAREGKIFG